MYIYIFVYKDAGRLIAGALGALCPPLHLLLFFFITLKPRGE